MKFLFVNSCIRGEDSRTYDLCRDYIEKFLSSKKNEEWRVEEVTLNDLDIKPLDRETLEKRSELAKDKKFDDSEFDLANQMINADHILIGAPYWDLSFPAKLKIYLERCSVTGLTFIYSPEGIPNGQCKAESLSYITTAGGPIMENNCGYDYIKKLSSLLGIKKTYFAAAEELDIIGRDIQKIMAEAKDKITDIIDGL